MRLHRCSAQMSSTPTAQVGQTLGTRPARGSGGERKRAAVPVFTVWSAPAPRNPLIHHQPTRPLRASFALIAPCADSPAYRGAVLAPARLRASALIALLLRPYCTIIGACVEPLPTHSAPSSQPPTLDEARPPALLGLADPISRRAWQALLADIGPGGRR